MKQKCSYTIETAVAAKIVAMAWTERRSVSSMAEVLILEAMENRGVKTEALIEPEKGGAK